MKFKKELVKYLYHIKHYLGMIFFVTIAKLGLFLIKGNISVWIREPALALSWFKQVLESVDFRASGVAQWHMLVR